MEDNNGYGVLPNQNRIIWEMTYNDGTTETVFEENLALASLLMQEKVFINSHWWKKEWPSEAQKSINIFVDCSDVFAWGCADAEDIEYSELRTLWEHHVKDPMWGCAVWCIIKRGHLPQRPVYNKIQSEGVWNLDNFGLKNNPIADYPRSNTNTTGETK